jgi:ribosomal protein S18 acetylase RimI-like enzyme
MTLIRSLLQSDVKALQSIDELSEDQRPLWGFPRFAPYAGFHLHEDHVGLVMEGEGVVLGYVLAYLTTETLVIVRMGVHRDQRRVGIASALLNRLYAFLGDSRAYLYANVPLTNLEACAFLKHHSFRCIVSDERDNLTFELHVPTVQIVE